MLRTTILPIVLALAVGATGSLTCELWCGTSAAEHHRRALGCHDPSQHLSQTRQIGSTSACHQPAGVTPFVAEVRQTASALSTAATPMLSDFGSLRPGSSTDAAGWWIVHAQPPRSPSPRAILRI